MGDYETLRLKWGFALPPYNTPDIVSSGGDSAEPRKGPFPCGP